jgi:RND family efflux transporter MFP subunit
MLVPILADGTLEPLPGAEIRSTEGGVVGQIFVHEGQHVAAGDRLLLLTSPELNLRVFASRGESQQLAEEERKSANELATLRRERDRLKAIAEADTRLLAKGAITAQQRSLDESTYEQAAQRAIDAEQQVASVAERKRTVDDATRETEQRLALLTIRAPIEGIIYNLPRAAGENIVPGQLIGNVADPHHLRVRIRVDSPDLPRIQVGQRLIITFDGLPNRSWNGQVILVPPGLRNVGGREVGEVIGQLSDDSGALPANASVNVEIVVGEKAAALVIPRSALLREGETRYVLRFIAAHARRQNVTVGLIGPNDVEIVTGLHDGDEVIIPGQTTIRDGEAVQRESKP